MADEAELNELRERVGKLRLDQQLHLFELLLGDYRRKCDEARSTVRAELDALREQGPNREVLKRAAG